MIRVIQTETGTDTTTVRTDSRVTVLAIRSDGSSETAAAEMTEDGDPSITDIDL